MADQPTVIYVAGSLQQAHMLKNLLAEQGIEAVVTNETLEKGSGVDYVGWSTLARVVVDEADASVVTGSSRVVSSVSSPMAMAFAIPSTL